MSEIKVYNIDFTIALEFKCSQKNIVFVSSYIPPQGSTYYNNNPTNNGIIILENVLSDLKSRYKDHGFIISGDFNARCGIAQPSSENVALDFYIGNDTLHDRNDKNYFTRTSEDLVTNTFGNYFKDMCQCLDLYIINGTDINVNSCSYTYIHPQGNSVVDFFLSSDDVICYIDDFIVHEMIDSLHMPISLKIDLTCLTDTSCDANVKHISKFIWDNEKSIQYQNDFSNIFREKLDCLIETMYKDINESVNYFSHMLTSCAHSMQVNFTCKTKPVTPETWFDSDCYTNKYNFA